MSAPAPLDAAWMRRHALPAPGDGGKEDRGRLLVVGGGVELVGAAMLAGVAALRAGAGKLQVAVAEAAVAPLSVALPEARVLGLPKDRHDASRSVDALVEHASRCDALLIGPGMMDDSEGLAAALLARATDQAIVLDAGALDAMRATARRSGLVLTPNAGEMARLLAWDQSRVDRDPLAAGREAVARFQAVVVMKGAETCVVSPERAGWAICRRRSWAGRLGFRRCPWRSDRRAAGARRLAIRGRGLGVFSCMVKPARAWRRRSASSAFSPGRSPTRSLPSCRASIDRSSPRAAPQIARQSFDARRRGGRNGGPGSRLIRPHPNRNLPHGRHG